MINGWTNNHAMSLFLVTDGDVVTVQLYVVVLLDSSSRPTRESSAAHETCCCQAWH